VSLESPRYKLYSALKVARAAWQRAEERWQDVVRHDFEEQHWNVLEPTTQATLAAIDRLAQVLLQARRECSE
jgi:hypothetical protein